MEDNTLQNEMSYRDRLKAKYPDMASQTDDDYNAMSEKYFNDTEDALNRQKDSEKIINELFTAEPELKEIFSDMIVNNTPFRVALLKVIPADELVPKEYDEDYEMATKAKNERLQKAEEQAKIKKEMAENELQSSKTFEEFCDKNNISESERETFMDIVNDNLIALMNKKVDEKFLQLCLKGTRYDKDVEDAAKAGEVVGRNAKIDAMKKTMKDEMQGDGVPSAKASSGKVTEKKKTKVNPFFDGMLNKTYI